MRWIRGAIRPKMLVPFEAQGKPALAWNNRADMGHNIVVPLPGKPKMPAPFEAPLTDRGKPFEAQGKLKARRYKNERRGAPGGRVVRGDEGCKGGEGDRGNEGGGWV
jgi:hypothetical protein